MNNSDFKEFAKENNVVVKTLRDFFVEILNGSKEGKISERYKNLNVYNKDNHKIIIEMTEDEPLINKGDSK